VRERAEGDQRLCLLHLAACYEQQGRSVEAERLLRAWLSSQALDQDVLCRLMEVLAEQGRMQEALTWYERTCEALQEEGEEPDRRTQETMEWMRALPIQRTPAIAKGAREQASRLPALIIPSLPNPGGEEGSRGFSASLFLDSSLLDRLERALITPMKPDSIMLDHLSSLIFMQKRQLVQGQGTSWHDLLIGASNNLRVFMNLLESHVQVDRRLLTLIGETCLLIADVLFNIGEYQMALRYYTMSIRVAQESRNATLQAIACGRYSLLLIDQQQPSQALSLADEAIQFAAAGASSLVYSWLWAVKGEAYANLGQEKPCLEALEMARHLLERKEEKEDCYTFVAELAPSVYGLPKLLGYEGACYLRLKQPEQAQRVLSISQRASSHPHHQSLVLADYAMTYIQQQAPHDACFFASKALYATQQTHSKRAFQRVLAVRAALTPWNDLPAVRDLEEQLLFSRQSL